MYTLTISSDDVKALEFVSTRYYCGTELLSHLLDSDTVEYLDSNEDDPDYFYGFVCYMSESQACQVCEMMDRDTEDMYTNHPLLGGKLWDKLVHLYYEIT